MPIKSKIEPNSKVYFHTYKSVYLIDPEKIIFCRKKDFGVDVCYLNNIIESVEVSFKDLEKKIPYLWKCHSDYLINLNYIDKIIDINEDLIRMINGVCLPVSKDNKHLLINEIQRYI